MPGEHEALVAAARAAFEVVAGTTSARIGIAHLASVVGLERLPPELRRRHREPEPMAFTDVERVLKAAWGRAPGKVLDDLAREPAAVTPAAQVHRALDAGGRPLAVKVRRPGLAEILRSDLVLIEAAAGALATPLPHLPLGAIVAEVRERLLDELDLEYEAATQRRFARALRDHPRLHVPAPVMELSEENVLVSDWVQGRSLRRLAAHGSDEERRVAAAALAEFVVGAPRLVGAALADPHPDDALLMPDGRLAIVDFGAVRDVPAARVALAAGALEAFAARDERGLAAALDDLGWMPGATSQDARLGLDIADDLAGDVLRGAAVLDAAALEQALERLGRHADVVAQQSRRTAVPPEDIWPLRGLAQLALVLAHLRVQADWVQLARAALGEPSPPAAP